MDFQPGSLTHVDTMDELRTAECTYERPVFVLPRSLPSDFNAAAEVIARHGHDNPCMSYQLSLNQMKGMAIHLSRLQVPFNQASLYDTAKTEIDFIITDMTEWQHEGIRPTLRFITAGSQFFMGVRVFHRDGMPDGRLRRMCSYTEHTTEGLRHCDASETGNNKFKAHSDAQIQRLSPGDISEHNIWWIHRAPQNVAPRLVLVGDRR